MIRQSRSFESVFQFFVAASAVPRRGVRVIYGLPVFAASGNANRPGRLTHRGAPNDVLPFSPEPPTVRSHSLIHQGLRVV